MAAYRARLLTSRRPLTEIQRIKAPCRTFVSIIHGLFIDFTPMALSRLGTESQIERLPVFHQVVEVICDCHLVFSKGVRCDIGGE